MIFFQKMMILSMITSESHSLSGVLPLEYVCPDLTNIFYRSRIIFYHGYFIPMHFSFGVKETSFGRNLDLTSIFQYPESMSTSIRYFYFLMNILLHLWNGNMKGCMKWLTLL